MNKKNMKLGNNYIKNNINKVFKIEIKLYLNIKFHNK